MAVEPLANLTPPVINCDSLPASLTVLVNCRLCIGGKLTSEGSAIVFSTDGGRIIGILHAEGGVHIAGDRTRSNVVDLQNAVVAPGFLGLQTNGMRRFHFTHFEDQEKYAAKLEEVGRFLPSTGVTGFWATIPTVVRHEFQRVLPCLKPRDFSNGACLLGAHAEGPYIHPSKKGAHNSALFEQASTPPEDIYGAVAADSDTLKLVTLAPELDHIDNLISGLNSKGIRVSLGHSNASYEQGVAGLKAGASCLTHTLNAMAPLHHRDPGLAGLVTAAPATLPSSPWFSIIPDGNHLHASVATMLFRANPYKCILITDSIELAGLKDGTYPGHAQIPFSQTKKGSRVVIEGTETLIGGCATMTECVQNLMLWSGCGIAEAVRCVTENIIDFMGDGERGKLEVSRRADLVVLDDDANVLETWIAGRKVWRKSDASE